MNFDKIITRYLKLFFLPVLIVRVVIFVAFWTASTDFGFSLFQNASGLSDYAEEIYYLIIYSIFMIPFFDLPLIVFLLFRDSNKKSLRVFSRAVLWGLLSSLIVTFLTLLAAICSWLVFLLVS